MNSTNPMNSMNPTNTNSRNRNSWGASELNNRNGNKQGGAGILEERSGLSVDDFLKIMAAEMQNQSPMGGSEGGGGSKTDYVSQLAQFTSLELMSEVVENLNYVNAMSQQQYAFTLIGKDVLIRTPELDDRGNPQRDENGNIIMNDSRGTVQSVKFKNGIPMANVRDEDGELKEYELGNIIEVAEKGGITVEEPWEEIGPSSPIEKNTDKEV